MKRLFLSALSLASLIASPVPFALAQPKDDKQTEMMSNSDMQARMDKMSAQMEEMTKMMKDMHSNMGKMMENGQCSMMGNMMGTPTTKKKPAKKATPSADEHSSHHPEEKK